MIKYTILLITLLLSSIVLSQEESGEDIAFYADVMVNAEQAEHRTLAAKKFESLIEAELNKDNSFSNSLENLPFIFVRYPDDKSFRTITWQKDKGEGKYDYDGYVQLADNTIFKMAGKRGRPALSERGSINWTQWKGGLIYKILTIPGELSVNHYLLTYRQLDKFTKAKTVELVSINASDVVLSEEALFADENGKNHKNRISLQYSADSNCNIKYQEEAQQIVYDNLIGTGGRMEGQGPTNVPDGSYKAYSLQKDGKWSYLDKLFDQTFTSPPRGGISGGGKDIIGRSKKRNK